MTSKTLFIEAVRAAGNLPPLLRDHADEVTGLEESTFDQSYIEFLDEQIRLSAKGPEWTQRLKARRAALLPYCEVTLLRGRVQFADLEFTVQVHSQTGTVIHWERYDLDRDRAGRE